MVLIFIISHYLTLPIAASAQEKQRKGLEQKSVGLTDGVVAIVNGEEILSTEYRSAYKKVEASYRDTYKDGFNDELAKKLNIKDKVIKDLIEKRLWLQDAQKRGLEITDDELRDNIMKMYIFHRNGRFDPSLYERILTDNRMNEKDFEEIQRKEFLTLKLMQVVRDSVVVTEHEVDEALNAESTSKKTGPKKSEEERQSFKKFLQFQKQEKAVRTHADEMYKKAKITINKKAL